MSIDPPTAAAAATEVWRTISPYDLSFADNPGAVISHPLLKGTNYDKWASGLKTILTSRKKFSFLDGTIVKPAEDSTDFEDWKTIQALLVSWIRMTIDSTLRSTISHRDVAQDLWNYLKKRFSVLSGSKLQQLKFELACCKQRGLAIESYYGKLNRTWDNLNSQCLLCTCSCGKCECDLATLQETDREEDKVHQFLYGIDDQFRSIRSSIVSHVPIQLLEISLQHGEEELGVSSEIAYKITAYAAQSKPVKNWSEGGENTMVCAHCNRNTHTSDKCFAVIGYPEWWGDRPKGRTLNAKGRGVPERGRGQTQYANCVYVPHIESSPEQANYVITDKDKDDVKLTG